MFFSLGTCPLLSSNIKGKNALENGGEAQNELLAKL